MPGATRTLHAVGAALVVTAVAAVLVPPGAAEAAETHVITGSVDADGVSLRRHPIRVGQASVISAHLWWRNGRAALDLLLRNASGDLVARGGRYGRPRTLAYTTRGGGAWTVVVRARRLASRYTLRVVVDQPPPPCSGVVLRPGMDVRSTVRAYSEGTTFCFQAGIYQLTNAIVPRTSSRLIAEPGTMLVGNDRYPGGFWGASGQVGVTVRGFVLERFRNPDVPGQRAMIKTGPNWTVENNEVRDGTPVGIEVNSGSVVRGNYVHHMGRYGLLGQGSQILVERNRIAYNNTFRYDVRDDAGGTKFYGGSTRLIARGNHIHNNFGRGLWSDWDNRYVTYENNVVENNTASGILHEASWDAVIRNTTVRNNARAFAGMSLWHGANILVHDSQNVEIYGNVVEGRGTNAIGLVDIARGSSSLGFLQTRNVHVHDNLIRMRGVSYTGMVGNRNPDVYIQAISGNRFEGNRYYVTDLSRRYWAWGVNNSSLKTWSGWRSAGNDTTGERHLW